MDAQLFLARADDHQPILDHGISVDMALDAPVPEIILPPATRWAKLSAPPDALAEQQWAIVAPKGADGDRLLELIAPLRKKREEEQSHEAIVYRVDPHMNALAASNWIQRDYRDTVHRRESDRPRYLLLLGNPDVLSWDLQQMLGGEAFVGRIAFEEDRDYEAYVEKVLRYAEARESSRANLLFHSVLDGTRATQEGQRYLMQPLLELAQSFNSEKLVDVPMDASAAAGTMLQQSAQSKAAMLFTMSHGAGIPKDGWKSSAEQRARQGAMVLGGKGELLTAADIANTAFLPGGMWFMFACYGAGTPARSAYLPWLEKLRTLGVMGRIPDNVLAALPKEGESPFVAALPRAALANPNGPLGVVGHVDLAWSWSFLDYDVTRTGLVPKSRTERFESVLQAFVDGHRFGVAHQELARFFRSVSNELTIAYEDRAQLAIKTPEFVEDPVSRVRRANLWMQRQDLSSYVLLGDPAARLPIARCPPGIETIRLARTTIDDEEVERRQDAVLAVLRGTASISTTAKRLGTSSDEIEKWVAIFIDAGRAALSKLS